MERRKTFYRTARRKKVDFPAALKWVEPGGKTLCAGAARIGVRVLETYVEG